MSIKRDYSEGTRVEVRWTPPQSVSIPPIGGRRLPQWVPATIRRRREARSVAGTVIGYDYLAQREGADGLTNINHPWQIRDAL